MHISRYETEASLNQYLLFHYGNELDQLAFQWGPKSSLNFPVRCVTECLDIRSLPPHAMALDLGCAVGRSSFELSRYCEKVVAIDNSKHFISAAKQIQQNGQMPYTLLKEGGRLEQRIAKIGDDIDLKRVEFKCTDAAQVFQDPIPFHVVLAANLICRLPNPLTFLTQLHTIIVSGGQLILTSPYSWLEEFTPKSHWLGKKESDQEFTLAYIEELLNNHFHLVRFFDMPFLMREHARLYQWGVAEASIWKRK